MTDIRDRLARDWAPTLGRITKAMQAVASPVEEPQVAAQADGVMVALMVPLSVGQDLALEGGEPLDQLHLTMVYLGTTDEVGDREPELLQVVQDWASTEPALDGDVAGKGMFTNGPTPVTYATVDVPGLAEARLRLVDVLQRAGFPVSHAHGFTPHITLAYADRIDADVPHVHLHFDAATVGWGGSYTGATFGNPVAPEPAAEEAAAAPISTEDRKKMAAKGVAMSDGSFPIPDESHLRSAIRLAHTPAQRQHVVKRAKALGLSKLIPDGWTEDAAALGQLQQSFSTMPMLTFTQTTNTTSMNTTTPTMLFGAPVQEARRSEEIPDGKAFVTELSGRTVLTAPAATFAPTWEKALTPNEHFLWMQGRFVGAEEPNRNNAFWSAGDLELGHATVQHGPLNWLHEARHVIGTIADARYIPAAAPTTPEAAAQTSQPHIVAASAIWRWIYPDEAWVVEQASEASKLWYSMECISQDVQCVGEGSCGAQVAYGAYMQGTGCQHMTERSATRRFVNPTFLGGAVIVPPVRPGWADADASTMAQAASLAEKAYDEAGHPDLSASEWELLMAQVVRYARGV